MSWQADRVGFPAPGSKQRLPLTPAPGTMEHTMLHQDGCLKTPLFGYIADALYTILDHMLDEIRSFCFSTDGGDPQSTEKPGNPS